MTKKIKPVNVKPPRKVKPAKFGKPGSKQTSTKLEPVKTFPQQQRGKKKRLED